MKLNTSPRVLFFWVSLIGWLAFNYQTTREPLKMMMNGGATLEIFVASVLVTEISVIIKAFTDKNKSQISWSKDPIGYLIENIVYLAHIIISGLDVILTIMWASMLMYPLSTLPDFPWMKTVYDMLPIVFGVMSYLFQMFLIYTIVGEVKNRSHSKGGQRPMFP